MTDKTLALTTAQALALDDERMRQAGQAANQVAGAHALDGYKAKKAANTIRRQCADLALFAAFLATVGLVRNATRSERDGAQTELDAARNLFETPRAWAGVTWGMVQSFVNWQLAQGYAIGSVNVRLSTLKSYAKNAMKAGAIDAADYALIRTVESYRHGEAVNMDATRQAQGTATRKGSKKAEGIALTAAERRAITQQPNTAQGRRDSVILALFFEHGLRCGELALLEVTAFDLELGTMKFYRPKVHKTQTHQLTRRALRAVLAYFDAGDAPAAGRLLRKSAKSKDGEKLGAPGMSERGITKRINALGARVGIVGLSAHDGRHTWATDAARNGTPIDRLMDAGGWNSYAMPLRYIHAAAVANEGVKLGADEHGD